LRLTCVDCGVVYREGAIGRQPILASGTACRRCGGELVSGSEPRGDIALAGTEATRGAAEPGTTLR
jgi:hypothetical protein